MRAMCRDVDKGRSVFPVEIRSDPSKLMLIRGDVTDPSSLSDAIEGCSAVISVHGTVHLTPWYKLLIPFYWTTHAPLRFNAGPTHPYFTNFVAMQDVLSLCEKHGVNRVVRLTGLSCAFPPYNPISVLFNALLSFSARYHRMGEEVRIIDSRGDDHRRRIYIVLFTTAINAISQSTRFAHRRRSGRLTRSPLSSSDRGDSQTKPGIPRKPRYVVCLLPLPQRYS